MDGGGQQLLSGAALAGDEDGVIRGGQALAVPTTFCMALSAIQRFSKWYFAICPLCFW